MGLKNTSAYKVVRSRYHQIRSAVAEGYRSAFVPYYRDIFQAKILSTRPFVTGTDDRLELHHLTCKRDMLNSLWSLKTFLHYSGLKPRLVIHSDGSLDGQCRDIFLRHFIDAVVLFKDKADEMVREGLRAYPRCTQWRFGKHGPCYSIRLFDFFFSANSKQIISLDADILFFKKPIEALELMKQGIGFYQKDTFCAYTFTPTEFKSIFKFDLEPYLNAGFFYTAGGRYFDLDLMEWVLKEAMDRNTNPIWWDQTLWAFCFQKSGMKFRALGPDYQIYKQRIDNNSVMHHFTRPVRSDLFSVGLKRLDRQGLLKAIS